MEIEISQHGLDCWQWFNLNNADREGDFSSAGLAYIHAKSKFPDAKFFVRMGRDRYPVIGRIITAVELIVGESG